MRLSFEKLKINDNSLFFYNEFCQYRLDSPFHYHDEYELLYWKNGSGRLFVGNHVTSFNDNELYLFAPRLPHCFYNYTIAESKNEKAHGFLFQFHPHFLGPQFIDMDETGQLKKLFEKSEYGIQIINPSSNLVDKIVHLNDYNNIQKLAHLLLIFEEIMNHELKLLTIQITPSINIPPDSKNILDVYKYVELNFQNQISFSEAALIANMQKAAFCRHFKRKALMKFSEFVNRVRISHAQKLLSETNKPTSQICFDCGFNNLTYFHKQFRLIYKVSPTEYRNLHKIISSNGTSSYPN